MKTMKSYHGTKFRFDQWADHYDRSPVSPFFRYAHWRVLRALNPRDGCRILDIGCGTGSLLTKIHRRIRRGELSGVDLSDKMIQVARSKCPSDIKFHVAEASRLPFDNNHFDAITSTISFHHYPDQLKVLGEMCRVLKNGGKLYLADHSFSYPPGLVYPMNVIMNMLEGPVQINGRMRMRKMMRKQGFRVQGANILALIATLYVCEKITLA